MNQKNSYEAQVAAQVRRIGAKLSKNAVLVSDALKQYADTQANADVEVVKQLYVDEATQRSYDSPSEFLAAYVDGLAASDRVESSYRAFAFTPPAELASRELLQFAEQFEAHRQQFVSQLQALVDFLSSGGDGAATSGAPAPYSVLDVPAMLAQLNSEHERVQPHVTHSCRQALRYVELLESNRAKATEVLRLAQRALALHCTVLHALQLRENAGSADAAPEQRRYVLQCAGKLVKAAECLNNVRLWMEQLIEQLETIVGELSRAFEHDAVVGAFDFAELRAELESCSKSAAYFTAELTRKRYAAGAARALDAASAKFNHVLLPPFAETLLHLVARQRAAASSGTSPA